MKKYLLMLAIATQAFSQGVPLHNTVPWWEFNGKRLVGVDPACRIEINGAVQPAVLAGLNGNQVTSASGLVTVYTSAPVTNPTWCIVTTTTNVPNLTVRVAEITSNAVTFLCVTNEVAAASIGVTNSFYYVIGQ